MELFTEKSYVSKGDKTLTKNFESQVKFILPTCKTKVGTGGKRRKTLRSPKSAAPSINNLKRIALSGISLDVNKKKKKKKKTETHLQQKQHIYSITEMNAKKEAELHKHMP